MQVIHSWFKTISPIHTDKNCRQANVKVLFKGHSKDVTMNDKTLIKKKNRYVLSVLVYYTVD